MIFNRRQTVDILEREVKMSEKKKYLTAKEYLCQLEMINEFINQDIERLSEMKLNAMSTGGIDYSRERVQTSAVGDRLCSDVVRYTELDAHINAQIDKFVDAKEQIIREIRELHNVEYIKILVKVYVQFKNLKITAAEMGKSYNHVIDAHKKALKSFEETHKNLKYLF